MNHHLSFSKHLIYFEVMYEYTLVHLFIMSMYLSNDWFHICNMPMDCKTNYSCKPCEWSFLINTIKYKTFGNFVYPAIGEMSSWITHREVILACSSRKELIIYFKGKRYMRNECAINPRKGFPRMTPNSYTMGLFSSGFAK